MTHQVDFVSGKTRMYGIVGDPIAQVRSPEMITWEFHRRGVDATPRPLE
jgi:shikimate dehydrogenase